MNMAEMTPYEKDLLLLGMISQSINDSQMTVRTHQINSERKRTRLTNLYYGHKRICRDTFMFLMNICTDKLAALKRHYEKNGLTIRKKKSGNDINIIYF